MDELAGERLGLDGVPPGALRRLALDAGGERALIVGAPPAGGPSWLRVVALARGRPLGPEPPRAQGPTGLTPDGRWLVGRWADAGDEIRRWDVAHGGTSPLAVRWNRSLVLSGDGLWAGTHSQDEASGWYTGDPDFVTEAWDLAAEREVWSDRVNLYDGGGEAPTGVLAGGRLVWGEGREAVVLDPATGRSVRLARALDPARAITSADGLLVFDARGDGFELWRTSDGECVRLLPEAAGARLPLALAPDGGLAISAASSGGAIAIWELGAGRLVARGAVDADDRAVSAAFDTAGRAVLVGTLAGRLWRFALGRPGAPAGT